MNKRIPNRYKMTSKKCSNCTNFLYKKFEHIRYLCLNCNEYFDEEEK